MDKDLVRCADCKKLGHPLAMVHVWVKTLCAKCAAKKLMNKKGIT
mgnify:FL=1